MKHLFFLLLLIVSQWAQAQTNVLSPDGNIQLEFILSSANQSPLYEVKWKNQMLFDVSNLGFEIAEDAYYFKNLSQLSTASRSSNSQWQTVVGEQSEIVDHYNELTVTLRNASQDTILITFRVYNEGFAFRYTLPFEGTKTVNEEVTNFKFITGGNAWVSEYAQTEIYQKDLNDINFLCDRPALVELDNGVFVALGEAALVDFARMKLKTESWCSNGFFAELHDTTTITGDFVSPWRYAMVGESAVEILSHNYMIKNLNEPNKLEDVSFIKPGKVLRDISMTTGGALECIDFCVEHDLEYVLFDAGWYGAQYDSTENAMTATLNQERYSGPFDFEQIRDSAKAKGIGIILYVNQIALSLQIDEFLPLYKEWGIRGIKFGFVDVGDAVTTSRMHEWVCKCAAYGIMVDIHDEYRPTGYERTYPNLMTCEGIRGDETSPSNEMVLKTLFTRMLAGAGDQTNVYFNERVDLIGSHASQLAKTICIYSPWQFLFWYDSPATIAKVPELDFFSTLPTVWDETKVLEGYPGENIAIARRNGNDWYVGAFTGIQDFDFSLDLDFIGSGTFEATIYSDDVTINTPTKVKVETRLVSSATQIIQLIKATDGLVIRLRKMQGEEALKPLLRLLSPIDQQVYTFDKAFEVTSEVIDAEGVKEVSLYVDNVLFSTKTAAPFVWNLPTTSQEALNFLRPGVHNLKVEATNTRGYITADSVKVKIVDYENVALGKTATQSSAHYADKGFASEVVDGDTNGETEGNTYNHTEKDQYAWWEVDLGENVDIEKINVWNRSSSSSRLTNFKVFVSVNPFTINNPNDLVNVNSVESFSVPGTCGRPSSVNVNTVGRYVRVQLMGTNFLHIAEVEVFSSAHRIVVPNPLPSYEVNALDTVLLDASNWVDLGGADLSYLWSSDEAGVVILNSTTATPSFIAPIEQSQRTVTVKVEVSTEFTTAPQSEVEVFVKAISASLVADAGSDTIVTEGDVVVLKGNNSYGYGNMSIENYNWMIDDVALSNSDSEDCSFVAPEVDGDSLLRMVLQVSSGELKSNYDTLYVTVKDKVAGSVDNLSVSYVDIYPNPAKLGQTVTLEIPSSLSAKYLKIYNSMGCLLFVDRVADSVFQLDSKNLKSGIYFIAIEGESETISRKIIIN